MKIEIEAVDRLRRGIEYMRSIGDVTSARLFEDILADEEHHIDYLETQLELIETLGEQLYLQSVTEHPEAVTRPASGGQVDQARDRGAVAIGRAQRDGVALGPLEVQVRGVLPGEADPAVHLDAFLGRSYGDVRAMDLGDRDCDRCVRIIVGDAPGGIAGHRPGLGHRHPQLGEAVLEPLERSDRPAELMTGLDVLDRGVQAPFGHAQLLAGEHCGTGG